MEETPDFKTISLSDRGAIEACLRRSGYQGAEYCFTSLFAWTPLYDIKIAFYRGFLLIRSFSEGEVIYNFPPGEGDVRAAVAAIERDAARFPEKPCKIIVSKDLIPELEALFPQTYDFIPNRDMADYIYDREALSTLQGKKLQQKRNHISYLKKNCGWSYETIDIREPERCLRQLEECREMNRRWCALYGCRNDESLSMETCSVGIILTHFMELALTGGILRVDGKVAAYTVGEMLNSDTFLVHIEKAFADIRGAYPMINQCFVQESMAEARYVNREDDTGDEGLRKAKLSYKPLYLIEKFFAVKK